MGERVHANSQGTAPHSYTLESAYGSVKPSTHPEDFEQVIQRAKDEKVEMTVRKLAEN